MNRPGLDPYGPPPDASARRQPDRVAPENACIECGECGLDRCGCCGFPLCGRHHETGGSFCTSHTSVGGVSVCVYRHEVYVGTFPREETVLVRADADERDAYHLPHEYDEQASHQPACSPDGEAHVRVTLENAADDLELCADCALEARHRYALFRRDLREEWEVDDAE
jgi:hypothetical protein